MSNSSSKIGRWIAAGLATLLLAAMFYNVVKDNMPKGDVRKIEGYKPWDPETLKVAETLPVQDGGRIKPLSTFAGFTMLSLHGARSMEIEGEPTKLSSFARFVRGLRGKNERTVKIKPTAWMMDTLFRPQLAIKLPTFRIDNSAVLEAIGVKTRGKRDRYSYEDIESGREKLVELAKSYEAIEKEKRDPVQTQTIDLAYQMRNYESLLGYFGFARFGVTLKGTGKDGAPDQRADISAVMMTAPQIRQQLSQSQAHGQPMEPHLQALLEQVLDASNFSKFGLFILPPADAKDRIWQSAGNAIMSAMSDTKADPQQAIADVKLLETTARAMGADEATFRQQLVTLRDSLAKRADTRGEYRHVPLEAAYYQKNWFLYAMVFFIMGTVLALAMWTVGNGKSGKVVYWLTLASTTAGLIYCIIPIVKRSVIMQRPPVGNLYDTIIFIAATAVLISLLIEWMTRRRFALGVAPILGTLLIILARRYEVGDAKDNMDPLVAVLDSNYWLTIHVLTITLGYSAGLLSAFLSFGYLLMRGLGLDDGDRDIRRSFTRAVYGMICLTLFLSLVGTVLGGIWANDSWGRFWGWDPKENGALMIVLWTLAILHARLGGYIRDWGLHFASVFTGVVVTFSWWHVNFLGVGLHNYGFTAGKNTIWVFYSVILAILIFGFVARAIEQQGKKSA
jgi:ABC-type transport system involved in cytochrome c biogenesis permease subunit